MEAHKNNDNTKEDYLSPTRIEQNNNSDKNQYKDADLSHEELQDRLEQYSRVGGQMDEYFKVQAMKEKYLKQIKEKEANRTKSDIHYAKGVRTGLPHVHIEDIRDVQQHQDQKLRNEVSKDAKEQYRDNNSLSKSFKEDKPNFGEIKKTFEKAKNKGMDRS